MGGMIRHSGGALLFSIPQGDVLNPKVSHSGSFSIRERLGVMASLDDGISWPVNKCLTPGPSAYSDLAVLPDDSIACLYEDADGLVLAKFDLTYLLQTAEQGDQCP